MKTLKIIMIAMLLMNLGFTQEFEDSPFGIVNLQELNDYVAHRGVDNFKYPLEAGVRWLRVSASWNAIEKNVEDANDLGKSKNNYVWSRTDTIASVLSEKGFNFMWMVGSWHEFDQGWKSDAPYKKKPEKMDAYLKFVRTLVERYDCDGVDDAEGSPVANYFQIENELDAPKWQDSMESFAELLRDAYEAIKEANPNAVVAIGGAGDPDGVYNGEHNYISVFEELDSFGGRYFDVMDVHWYKFVGDYKEHPAGNHKPTEFIPQLKNTLEQYGYGDVEIWFTEVGTHSGSDVSNKYDTGFFDEQTETEHAAELLKRYVCWIGNGVSKVFWWTVSESRVYSNETHNDYFDNVGLIYNGVGGQDDPGEGVKKLAYYTYKLMTEKLEGSDWDNVQTLIDGTDNVYAYKFKKEETGEPVYVAWWDYYDDPSYSEGDTKIVTIEAGDMDTVRVTEAVPTAESGAELDENDYPTFFASEIRQVDNGKLTITLGKKPVFVEDISSITSVEEETSSFLPRNFKLEQNYPNPFNPQTTIEYQLPISGRITLRIFNVLGQEVKTEVDHNQSAGSYSVIWDGKDTYAKDVTGGIYFYQLSTKGGKAIETKKLLLLR